MYGVKTGFQVLYSILYMNRLSSSGALYGFLLRVALLLKRLIATGYGMGKFYPKYSIVE